MIIFIIIVLILLYLTYSEIKRIQKHSAKKHKHDHKAIEVKLPKRSTILIALGLAILALIVYLVYPFIKMDTISNKISKIKNETKSEQKVSKQKKSNGEFFSNTKAKSNGSSKTNKSNNTDTSEEKTDEIKETIAYKFFKKYEHIFGTFITEDGKHVVTDRNEFEVVIKKKKVNKVKIIYPFEKKVYDLSAVNLEAAKKTIKKYGELKQHINPIDNSVDLLNETIKKTLMNPDSFKYIKTDLLDEKREYLILKVTFEEQNSNNKSTIKSRIARLYLDGKVKMIN